jgi:transcriptional regulator with XRE-family HTH domain
MLGGDLVREARRRAGLTQAELATRAETTQSAIARLESGRTSPTFDQLQRLLKLCGFRLDVSLAGYDDSELSQAQGNLRNSTEGRLANMESALQFIFEGRRALKEPQRA